MTGHPLAARCVQLYRHPAVCAKGWLPNLFWRPAGPGDPFGSLRVDPWELEVLFAAITGEPSVAREVLDARREGRSGFIERSIAHGELPLLRYRDGAEGC